MANYDGSIKIDTKVDTGGFSSGFTKMKSIAAKGVSAITASLTAVSTAIIGCGTAAVNVGSSFESAMDKVSAISGATGEDLQALTGKAKEMGATTKFSASESAEALQYMAMAGWQTEDMLEGISGVMSLSAADGLDLATTSDIVTDAITAFGLQAKDSGHFADVLAKASSSANTNVSMLGESFKYVAPLAGTMGYSVEDVSIALGLMANASVKGSMAGTSLKTALANLSAPTKNMKEVMEKYKISITDANGETLPLIGVIKELREKFGGLSEAEQTAAASTLFGKEAMSGMLAIINASDSDFNKLVENINNADGAAQSMADTMQDNLQGQITILKSALEGLGIELYEGMQEPLKEAAIEAQNYVNRLTSAFNDGGLTGMIEEAGNIFGELAVKAAEHAPEMVEAAFSFLESFVRGIASNSDKLIDSAKKIVSTIVDNLVKLLPPEVQKPVRETIENIKRSFKNGGLRTAINTVKTVIQNLGKVITNIAKVIIPPLSKAIDFLSGNTRTLIVAATALFTAYKAYKIFTVVTAAIKAHTAAVTAESLAQAASTGAITLKQIALGVLTGQLSVATAAQYALNLAMSLNPIGIVIAAVSALTAGLVAFALSADDATDSSKALAEAQEKLEESNKNLDSAYKEIGEQFGSFLTEIESAGSIFDNFNENILISDEDKKALSDNMDAVQSEITEVCKTAAEERRSLTSLEIERLDELFQKMHELADQELALEQQKQGVVLTQAEALNSAAGLSLDEYYNRSQRLLNSAEETRKGVIDKAYEQYTEEVALLNLRLETEESFTQKEYEQLVAAAEEQYQTAIGSANKQAADTISIIQKGYMDRADVMTKHTAELKKLNEEEDKLNKKMAQDILKINEDYLSGKISLSDKEKKEGEATNDALTRIAEIRNERAKLLNDENYKNQLSDFMDMEALYETYAGKTNVKAIDIVNAFFDPIKAMPEESRRAFADVVNGCVDGLDSREDTLFAKAASIAGTVINTLRSAFAIHSPSRVTKKIFQQVVEGGEGGLDEESPKLFKKEDDIAQTFIKKLKVGISTEGLIAKLHAGIAEGRAFVANALTAKVVHDIDLNTEDANRKVVLKGDIVTHMNIDGREFAVASAPYVSEELSWQGGV